ncbi:MAG: hypothetical protein ACFE9R_02655 [Candidatus Hermodarchaeota archaeon]
MSKAEIIKKKDFLKENKGYILGVITFFTALVIFIWFSSLGYYW